MKNWVWLLCACSSGSPSQARVSLADAGWTLAQHDTAWQLTNTGSVEAAQVKWTIAASPGTPPRPTLLAMGSVIVRSTGALAAPVGNAIVRLQTQESTGWVTRAIDVADTTSGGAARFVVVVDSGKLALASIGEATGMLALSDGRRPHPIPRAPVSPVLEPNTSQTIRENVVLGLRAGSRVRIQAGVSYGNAGKGSPTADIDGSGMLEPDEREVATAWVTFAEQSLPALTRDTHVAIIDTEADLSTTGDVTLSKPAFQLGSTSGTATVSFRASDDATLTNCAHLIGIGVDETACDTQRPVP